MDNNTPAPHEAPRPRAIRTALDYWLAVAAIVATVMFCLGAYLGASPWILAAHALLLGFCGYYHALVVVPTLRGESRALFEELMARDIKDSAREQLAEMRRRDLAREIEQSYASR